MDSVIAQGKVKNLEVVMKATVNGCDYVSITASKGGQRVANLSMKTRQVRDMVEAGLLGKVYELALTEYLGIYPPESIVQAEQARKLKKLQAKTQW